MHLLADLTTAVVIKLTLTKMYLPNLKPTYRKAQLLTIVDVILKRMMC